MLPLYLFLQYMNTRDYLRLTTVVFYLCAHDLIITQPYDINLDFFLVIFLFIIFINEIMRWKNKL